MSVYVDDAVHLWRGLRWAHLMADSVNELTAFAARLGLPAYKLQDKRSGVHYDVDARTRERALALGAIPISRHHDRARVRAVILNAKRQWSGATDRASGASVSHSHGDPHEPFRSEPAE